MRKAPTQKKINDKRAALARKRARHAEMVQAAADIKNRLLQASHASLRSSDE